MKHIFKTMTVLMAVIFICNNIALATPSSIYAKDDYRLQNIKGLYNEIIPKPIAKFAAIRSNNGKFIKSAVSYDGKDINEPFPVLECYVGDTLTFEDYSSDPFGRSIVAWDWQYYGTMGDHHNEYSYNIVNKSSIYLNEPGETTFFLCVKSDAMVKKGSCDPWSENGNHQTIGKNKSFSKGMYWYFTAIKIVVKPMNEAKVHVRYWDAQSSCIFWDNTVNLGELQGDNDQKEASIHITDWDGYEFYDWLVVLPDNTVQYSGTERDVGITLASWLPEKYLNVEFYPYKDTEVRIRYWDSNANRIMFEESVFGDKMVRDKETTISVPIRDLEGYTFTSWNVQLPDSTVQYEGTDRSVGIILNGLIHFKYLNIDYLAKESHTETTPTPLPTDNPIIKPPGICDGEIIWTEIDSHKVTTGKDKYGDPQYRTCNHTFTYKAILSADVTVTPNTLKSGYGFEIDISCSMKISLVKNEGCSSWGNDRAATSTVKNPTKATVYIPWSMSNRLGIQSQSITMDNYKALKFKLPVSNVSETGARKIYTPVELAGTKENPVSHSFDIYINGGGVGNVEFCKKITKAITINGDMYSDDFSGEN